MKYNSILHIVAGMDPKLGGVSQAIRNFIKGSEQLCINNEILCMDDSNAYFLQNENFNIHALGPGITPWVYSPKLIPWLLENLNRFDLVIHHGLWLYPSFALKRAMLQFKKLKNQPTYPRWFLMPHGMLDPYFQKAPDRRLKAIRNWVYWKYIESKVVDEADGMLFTCKEERILARETFSYYNPKQELVIGLGVEKPPSFDPSMKEVLIEMCPSLKNRSYFLFLSRIHEKKGVDILIKAYCELCKYYEIHIGGNGIWQNSISSTKKYLIDPQSQLPILVIAGPGNHSKYGQKMQDLAINSVNSMGEILFPGMISGDAKWGAFYGCEAFVLPSHQENFGIAVVEALACSKPVLISNKINIWREIESSSAGMICEDNKAGILSLLENWQGLTKNEKALMISNAKKTYYNHFALEQNAENFFTAVYLNNESIGH